MVVGLLVGTTTTGASAEPRPTEAVGPWSFDASDVIAHLDAADASIRVHYSTEGPNRAALADDDGDGTPDFVAQVLAVAIESHDHFVDTLGFRPPVAEAALGPGPGAALGGSPGFDVYLVDFGGAADGRFGVDGCTAAPEHCAGFLVVENDFAGYGYASLQEAADTVVVHEMFHAIQAAYTPLPVWASEGGAVWAQRQFSGDSRDFLRFCDALLADHERSLHRPPLGPVPGFAYGSALWWDFVGAHVDDGVMIDLLEAGEQRPDDVERLEEVMVDVLADAGVAIEDAWTAFVQANLATGSRAGAAGGHMFAAELAGIEPDAAGSQIDVDARLYPLAASYWRIDHGGGALHFATDAALADVRFSLHAAAGPDGPVEAAHASWVAEGDRVALGELPEGTYWIVATLPQLAEMSARARVCIGGDDVEQCLAPPDDPTGTTGEPSGADTVGETATATDADESGESSGSETTTAETAAADDAADGCGCATVGRPPVWLAFALPIGRRRRRSPR